MIILIVSNIFETFNFNFDLVKCNWSVTTVITNSVMVNNRLKLTSYSAPNDKNQPGYNKRIYPINKTVSYSSFKGMCLYNLEILMQVTSYKTLTFT